MYQFDDFRITGTSEVRNLCGSVATKWFPWERHPFGICEPLRLRVEEKVAFDILRVIS
jgi:hypothetical protein